MFNSIQLKSLTVCGNILRMELLLRYPKNLSSLKFELIHLIRIMTTHKKVVRVLINQAIN